MQSTPARTARFTDSAARQWQATRLPQSCATFDAGAQLLLAHRDDFGPRVADELVAGNVELDVVDALAAAEPHGLADFVDAVGDHAEALGMHMLLALVTETAGDGDLGPGGSVARAGEIAVLDLLPDHDVDAHLGGGCRIAAGEAVVEDKGGVAAGAEQMLLRRDFAEVLVAGRTDEGKVAVALDHARHQELPLPVDDVIGILAADDLAASRDRPDAVAFDEDLAWIGLVIDAVPDR